MNNNYKFEKIIAVGEQVETVTTDIIRATEEDKIQEHYIESKYNGLLYINSLEGLKEDIKSGKYNFVGYINTINLTEEQIKESIEEKIKRYNNTLKVD